MPPDDGQSLVKLLTVLFREAEKREGLDNGEMLRSVLDLQDTMLRKGVSAMDDWLEEAELQNRSRFTSLDQSTAKLRWTVSLVMPPI